MERKPVVSEREAPGREEGKCSRNVAFLLGAEEMLIKANRTTMLYT